MLSSGKTQQPELVGSGGWPKCKEWFADFQHLVLHTKTNDVRPPDPTISGCFKQFPLLRKTPPAFLLEARLLRKIGG
ncbi:MAG: hypothetical protein AB1547_13070 [Thermodesulfobacteriota bacterium]